VNKKQIAQGASAHKSEVEALKKAGGTQKGGGGDAVRRIKKSTWGMLFLSYILCASQKDIHTCIRCEAHKKKERKSIPHVCPLKLPLQAVTSCEEVDALV
jgi:hypothetical protein